MSDSRLIVVCVGLGAMGSKLAARLAACGRYRVVLMANTDAGNALAETLNVPAISTTAEVAGIEPDVILTCVPTSRNVASLSAMLIAAGLKRGSLWIDATSGDPTVTKRLALQLRNAADVAFVDCGLSGGPSGAQKGSLIAMVGGDLAGVDRARPLLESFCGTIVQVGPSGAGHAVKAVNNILMASNLWAAGEGLAILVKMGIDPGIALKVMNSASGRSSATQGRLPDNVLSRKFDYGFLLPLLNKDIDTALALASDTCTPAPMLTYVRQLYQNAGQKLGPDSDHVEAVKIIESRAGVELGIKPTSLNPVCPSLRTMDIELAVFDMAGTTISEGRTVHACLQQVLEEAESLEDASELAAWYGASKLEIISHFITEKGGSEEKVAKVYARFNKLLVQRYFGPESEVRAVEGAVDTLQALRDSGIKICLNTGYAKDLAMQLVDKAGLSNYIDGLISAEEVPKGRPYPYMIYRAMEKFGIQYSSRVVKIGDTARDMEEGRSAACGLVIGVLSGADDSATLSQAGADILLPSVAQLRT